MRFPASTLLPCILMFSLACGSGEKKETEATPYQQLMDLHDQTMSRMDELYQLKQQLSEQLAKHPDTVRAVRDTIQHNIEQLNTASKSMMGWMHQFNPSADSLSVQDKDAYYKEEYQKMEDIRDQMSRATDDAKKTLGK